MCSRAANTSTVLKLHPITRRQKVNGNGTVAAPISLESENMVVVFVLARADGFIVAALLCFLSNWNAFSFSSGWIAWHHLVLATPLRFSFVLYPFSLLSETRFHLKVQSESELSFSRFRYFCRQHGMQYQTGCHIQNHRLAPSISVNVCTSTGEEPSLLFPPAPKYRSSSDVLVANWSVLTNASAVEERLRFEYPDNLRNVLQDAGIGEDMDTYGDSDAQASWVHDVGHAFRFVQPKERHQLLRGITSYLKNKRRADDSGRNTALCHWVSRSAQDTAHLHEQVSMKKSSDELGRVQMKNAPHVANQVSAKDAADWRRDGAEKASRAADTAGDQHYAKTGDATTTINGAEEAARKQRRDEPSVAAEGADPVAVDAAEGSGGDRADPLAPLGAPLPMEVDGAEQQKEETVVVMVEGGEEKQVEQGSTKQSMEDAATAADADVEDAPVAMDVDAGGKDQEMAVESGEASEAPSLPAEEVRSPAAADAIAENSDNQTAEKEVVAMKVEGNVKKADSVSVEAAVVVDEVLLQSVEETPIADSHSEESKTSAAGDANEDVEMTSVGVSHTSEVETAHGEHTTPHKASDSDVTNVVGQIVDTLVDHVVQFVNETVSVDAESVKIMSSPITPHLSTDEALELLEVHQGDDHELLPEHDAGADADVEAEPSETREYQWFDGDDDDDEGVAIEAPSILSDVAETTDDVFEFGGVVDLTGAPPNIADNADINSDGSGDTLVIPSSSSSGSSSSSSSSSSSASSGSSSSSSSSSSSASSASEDEAMGNNSKKRRVSGSSGPRKLLKYKKQKRARASNPETKSSHKRYKRKRKIPEPVIPPEFAVFDQEAADPILRGTYAVRNNRRACFVGNWGFSDEAFQNIESVSPFEYTSRARVLQSRRKVDKRPVSGKYGGFFKLRQFNGTLVKIREDQVELQFLPMPSSDGEDEDEDMEGYASDEDDGEEAAASRYVVLGRGIWSEQRLVPRPVYTTGERVPKEKDIFKQYGVMGSLRLKQILLLLDLTSPTRQDQAASQKWVAAQDIHLQMWYSFAVSG
ncbi:unnamed protein product [Phytophthora lilii]|uniref:Unnamed protein product n=1 Tax=Phytophthora lilii TaxID=2077276 RepID=A0A9W6TL41_9STRA|nr:unnamed protein product [Phytophthora lilii]